LEAEVMTMEPGQGGALDRVLRVGPWVVASVLISLPLLAMQVTDEVDWTLSDFAIIGALLFGGCALYELAARAARSIAHRLAVGIAIGTGFLLIWINLAVGVIGSEDNAANLMYVGVLAFGVLGALFVRARPNGMARVLAAMSLAHVVIAVVTLGAGWGSEGENWPLVIIVLNGVFALAWLISAGLFRNAAGERT
jgi:hypothetical protein